jgi:hypothetical protein
MQKMYIPGLSLAVVTRGKVIKASGYGRANLETGTPVTAHVTLEEMANEEVFLVATRRADGNERQFDNAMGSPDEELALYRIRGKSILTVRSHLPMPRNNGLAINWG